LRDPYQTPLFDTLKQFADKKPVSFHVPGHKSGALFPKKARDTFASILPIDLTELTGLDDLHAPDGVIRDAQAAAAEFFGAEQTFFLVNGSTVGNLAMILAAVGRGERVIVQRNCHKSIMNGLELAGALPVFIAPEYDPAVRRYTHPSFETLEEALRQFPDTKAVILTYPDYFGSTYPLEPMIKAVHGMDLPVLIDEAHGVHFALGEPLPPSALSLGADVVVQSAHKMAPAMTMASYLHIQGNRISGNRVAHYLQMLQSSSPSYPLMASLDVARMYLETLSQTAFEQALDNIANTRKQLQAFSGWDVLPVAKGTDPFKVTLQMKDSKSGFTAMKYMEAVGLYPELATQDQVLLVLGLQAFKPFEDYKKAWQSTNEQLKKAENHATMDLVQLFPEKVMELAFAYDTMNIHSHKEIPLQEGIGYIAAEPVIPYPPGIPLLLRGERITKAHVRTLQALLEQGANIQQRQRQGYISIFAD